MKKQIINVGVVVAILLATVTSQGVDLSSLTWSADSGTRVTGPSGCVHPTFVMARPDGKCGMYFYDGDGWTFGDTGYATSIDGENWNYEGRILLHGGNGFDNIDAVITDIISLPGGGLRAYCSGMRTNQSPVKTSIFYTETNDMNGVNWSNPRTLLFPEETRIGCPRVLGSAENGYTMYFYSDNQIIRRTSANGIDNWSDRQVVIDDFGNSFDIVERQDQEEGFRMFVGIDGLIKSLNSTDGITWSWDVGARLTPDLFDQTSLGSPVLAEINGIGKMYIYGYPERENIYSATIPEPATIFLLSLGGVILRKKR